MSPKYKNKLMVYVLDVNESPELAEEKAQEFEQKFMALSKYDQMEVSLLIETGDWVKAFTIVGVY